MELDDQLSWLIGRVVRVGALAEMEARRVQLALLGDSLAAFMPHTMHMNATLGSIEAMVKHADLDPDRLSLALRVVVDSRTANSERNRCVHDIWYPNSDVEADSWIRLRWQKAFDLNDEPPAVKPLVSRAELGRTVEDLDSAGYKLNCLMRCLVATLPSWAAARPEPFDYAAPWTELALAFD